MRKVLLVAWAIGIIMLLITLCVSLVQPRDFFRYTCKESKVETDLADPIAISIQKIISEQTSWMAERNLCFDSATSIDHYYKLLNSNLKQSCKSVGLAHTRVYGSNDYSQTKDLREYLENKGWYFKVSTYRKSGSDWMPYIILGKIIKKGQGIVERFDHKTRSFKVIYVDDVIGFSIPGRPNSGETIGDQITIRVDANRDSAKRDYAYAKADLDEKLNYETTALRQWKSYIGLSKEKCIEKMNDRIMKNTLVHELQHICDFELTEYIIHESDPENINDAEALLEARAQLRQLISGGCPLHQLPIMASHADTFINDPTYCGSRIVFQVLNHYYPANDKSPTNRKLLENGRPKKAMLELNKRYLSLINQIQSSRN